VRFYRVFPYLRNAAPDDPGGVFFRPSGGKNRADSPVPGIYRCLYVGDSVEGSVAEAFGRFDMWDAAVIEADPAAPTLPGSRFALAAYDLPDAVGVRDLDDARTLLGEGLRPSQVVTRDRHITQAWSARIQATSLYAGVSWWSYYDSAWQSAALWDISALTVVGTPRPLSVTDAEVNSAARTIVRRLIASPRRR
jgi:hypothetical protein